MLIQSILPRLTNTTALEEFSLMCSVILISIVLLEIYLTRLTHQTKTKQPPHKNQIEASITRILWLTSVAILGVIWFWTVIANRQDLKAVVGIAIVIGAFGIMASTFFLEGLEIAYTSLKDKELRQITNKRLFGMIKESEPEFYEAREWCVIALVVFVTIMVDKERYVVPFIGPVETKTIAGKFLRGLITFGLTTFPFVWIAQSPAKELAIRNADFFLQIPLTAVVARGVLIVGKAVRLLRLKEPSDLSTKTYENIFNELGQERNLPPGEIKSFTDTLKKYGYGVVVDHDTLTIQEGGVCEFKTRVLIYMCAPRHAVSRSIGFESAIEGTPDIRFGMFAIEEVRESVEDNLKLWFDIFDTKIDEIAEKFSLTRVDDKSFKPRVSFKKRTSIPGQEKIMKAIPTPVNMSVVFPEAMPKPPEEEKSKKGALVVLEVHGKAKANAFKILSAGGSECEDFYSKFFVNPTLRSELEINLGDKVEGTFSTTSNDYTVTFEDTEHLAESERFRLMQTKSAQLQAYESRRPRAGITHQGRKLMILFESALPGASYLTYWRLRSDRQDVIPENESGPTDNKVDSSGCEIVKENPKPLEENLLKPEPVKEQDLSQRPLDREEQDLSQRPLDGEEQDLSQRPLDGELQDLTQHRRD